MKAETKSKRRVTLSLVGLSTLDESEVESIPGAQPVPVPADSPVPSRVRLGSLGEPPAGPPTEAPANVNETIPDSWKPFIRTEAVTATIVGGKRSKATGKTTITLEGGARVLDHRSRGRRRGDRLQGNPDARHDHHDGGQRDRHAGGGDRCRVLKRTTRPCKWLEKGVCATRRDARGVVTTDSGLYEALGRARSARTGDGP